ncbi:MAG TPA: FAD-binding protein, partial [Acidimicrobiia bacterium]|nr:FAD-binding protein [Acidimicrobiia bacterium]
VPRDVASRAAMRMVQSGRGVGRRKNGVYLDFADPIARLGRKTIEDRYGNLFEMYERITDENPYEVPMRIYPAPHYTMGGLWVDYNLETTIPGLFAAGEANFSDHGANRLGASALMQGVADGYFVLPATISSYLANWLNVPPVPTDDEAFVEAEKAVSDQIEKFLSIDGTKSVDYFHRRLGKVMIAECGMSRSAEGLERAIKEIAEIKRDFWTDLRLLGSSESLNQSLERAGRVADFLELGDLMVRDALDRNESCGGHFRLESQTEEGEALRDDENYAFVSAWEWTGEDSPPIRHKEPLEFEYVALSQRSYK